MPILVQLIAQKHTLGAAQEGGEFSYELHDSAGEIISSSINSADGTIVFPEISLDDVDDYNFKIVEIETGGNWENNSPTSYNVTVVVEEDSEDELVAQISYPDTFPLFTNTYTEPTKGLIEFGAIEYTEPGVYRYTIRELTGSGGAWTTDDSEFEIIVTVTDDGNGNLIPSVSYPDGFPEFTNRYSPTHASIILTATKLAIGANLPAGKFQFGLFDESGALIETATNGSADETKPLPPA